MNLLKKILRAWTSPGKKRVVYTCMFGFSEAFQDRATVDDGKTDYLCFTDDTSLSSENWKFVHVDTSKYGIQKTSKLVKTCPHFFLSRYDSSLYVDNTVRINASPDEIWSHLSDDTPFVLYKHPMWDCPFVEADKVTQAGYADPKLIAEQIAAYERDGLPRNVGLFHGAILLRRHNDPHVKDLDERWFSEIKKYTYRDQVPLCYLVWKLQFKFGIFDGSARDDKLMLWPDNVGPRLPRAFDENTYLRINPGLDLQGMSPREHYFKVGMAQGLPWTA
jgi:hypothetical protein